MRLDPGENSTIIFEKGYQDYASSGSGAFNTCGSGTNVTYVFNGPVRLYLTYKELACFSGPVTHVWNAAGNYLADRYQLANTVADCRRDYAFELLKRLMFNGGSSNKDYTRFELNGTKQCVANIITTGAGYGTIHGDAGSELEITEGPNNLADANSGGKTNLNVDVTGAASLKMSGAGYLLLKARAYSSCGDLAVTRGTMAFEQGASWFNGTNVTVSGTGRLVLNDGNVFSSSQVTLHLKDDGVVEVPAGCTQRVFQLWLDEDEKPARCGTYGRTGSAADFLTDHVAGGGFIRVVNLGTRVILR